MRTVRTAIINRKRQVTFTPQELLEVGVALGDQFARYLEIRGGGDTLEGKF